MYYRAPPRNRTRSCYWQKGFMSEVTSVLETPWALSTGPDLAFPSTRGDRPEKFEEAQQFETALFRAVVVDPVVHRALTEVGQPPSATELVAQPRHHAADRSGFRRHTRVRSAALPSSTVFGISL